MSSGGRDPRPKGSRKQDGFELELSHIVVFLRGIAAMTGALLLLSLLFFLLSEKTAAANVAYSLTILVNLAACGGSVLAAWYLDRKDRELNRREQEKYKKK